MSDGAKGYLYSRLHYAHLYYCHCPFVYNDMLPLWSRFEMT